MIDIFTTLKKSKEKILVKVNRKYISFIFKFDNKELLKENNIVYSIIDIFILFRTYIWFYENSDLNNYQTIFLKKDFYPKRFNAI